MAKLICIDAGHGGSDSGAVGNEIYEKDITLKTSLIIGKMLQKQGFKVIYTRTTDKYISLGERCRIANESLSDLFISIHVNSATNTSAKGTETLCYSKNKLAELLQKHLIKNLNTKDRGIKERKDLYVLNGTKMLANLIEIAFLSNYEDSKLLKQTLFLEEVGKAVTLSVCEYYGINYKENPEDIIMQKNIDVVVNGKKGVINGYFAEDKNLFTADFIRSLGIKVEYDEKSKVVTFSTEDYKKDNKIKINVNGEEKNVTSIFKNNLNYVMLRDLEKLGLFDLEYKDNTIYITTKN